MEIIPLFCFLLMVVNFTGSFRERFLLAAIGWGVFVLFATESLSIWHRLDRLGLVISWVLFLMVLGTRYLIVKPPVPTFFFRFNLKCTWIVLMVSVILLITAVIAFFAAPNNWDSMTYHLARVAFWAQNRTVAMFPTTNLRQIFYPPWASYAVLQFYILTNNDRWANFIQWFSSLGSMIGVSLIAARLKGRVSVQALAALIVATIPMGILQSTSTQNDYVLAFWLVCFVYFGMSLLQEARWHYSVAAGMSLGLAWLVKGIGYVDGLPFLIWFVFGGIKIHGRKFIIHLGAILLIALLLNSSYYMRNYSLTGTIIPSSESEHVIVKQIDLKVMAANLVLNVGLHAATVWDGANRLVEKSVDQLIRRTGLDPDDQRLYLEGTKFQILDPSFRFHEDYAGNFLHALLILFSLLAFLFLGKDLPKDCRYYVFALLGAILLFVIMIKWSPYHSRYHLPVFILFAPILALVLGNLIRSWRLIVLAFTLLLASIPWLVGNKTRPLLGVNSVITTPRVEQYFVNKEGDALYAYSLMEAGQVHCKQIGLILGSDSWEYPLMALSQWQKQKGIRFDHILVSNISAKLPYPLGAFDPCFIIKRGEGPDILNWQEYHYAKVDQRESIVTYMRIH